MTAVVGRASPPLAGVVARVAGFVSAMFDQEGDGCARTAMECLATAHLCRVATPSAQADAAFAHIVANMAEPDWLVSDLVVALTVVHSVLVPGPGRRFIASAADYARLLGKSLDAAPNTPNQRLLQIALTGAAVAFPSGPTAVAGLDDALAPLVMERSYRAAAAAVEIATGFGVVAASVADPIPLLMEGAAIAAFRAHDLPMGLRLVRVRCHLGPPAGRGVAAARAFILATQGQDGGFGDYDTEIARIEAAGVTAGKASAAARLRLPVTFQAIWTLMDMDGGSGGMMRRLFGDHGLLGLLERAA